MRKLIAPSQSNFYRQVAVCSVKTSLTDNPISVSSDVVKITAALSHAIGSHFILFPEYTYSNNLQQLYQDYCNQHKCVIIGGSGLESVGTDYYAYAPVFMPNQEIIKVYKKNTTPREQMYGVIDYPHDVIRGITIEETLGDFSFSVFVCNDFLVAPSAEHRDISIVFVPQYEGSPQQFMYEGAKISKGMRNFVLGANTSNDNQKSFGFGVLNSTVIKVLTDRGWRRDKYITSEHEELFYHPSIFYDSSGEKLFVFKVNINKPSMQFDFTLRRDGPAIIPIKIVTL